MAAILLGATPVKTTHYCFYTQIFFLENVNVDHLFIKARKYIFKIIHRGSDELFVYFYFEIKIKAFK